MQEEARHDEGAEEDLSALITRRLAELERSQRWLANEAGIPVPTLNAWVRRQRNASSIEPDRLRELADALGLAAAVVFRAAGRKVPGALDAEREKKLLKLYRQMPADAQRHLVQQAEMLVKIARAS